MDLAYEVIVHIFKFLSYSDRKIARLVCKQFYDASLDEAFVRNEIFLVIKERVHKDPYLSILRSSNRVFRNFYFIDVNFTEDFNLIFEKFGDNIYSVLIEGCSITDQQFIDILLGCKNLKSLTLKSCEDPLRSGVFSAVRTDNLKLEKMRCLNFNSSRYVTDAIIWQFITFCPNLESLSFSDCYISFHVGTIAFFYRRDQKTALQRPSINGLTFRCIMEILELRSKCLKNLDFSSTHLTDNALRRICELEGLKLQSLNLNYCRELKFAKLNIGSLQPNLTELHLNDCPGLSDCILVDICEHLVNLKVLKIANCQITDDGIASLNKLRKLQYLDISKCTNLSVKTVVNNLGLAASMQIFHANEIKLQESDVVLILKTFKNLIELELTNCGLNNACVAGMFKYQNKLMKLILSKNCQLFTSCFEHGNTNMLNNIPDLQPINAIILDVVDNIESFQPELLENNETFVSLRDEFITVISNVNVPFTFNCFESLTCLDVSNCISLSDSILYVCSAFKHVNVMKLENTKTSDGGLIYLSLHCPAIEVLQVNGCKITDVAMYFVVKYLKRIKSLNISNCCHLTDITLILIYYYCKSLSELDVSQCSKMSEEMMYNMESLPSLHNFHNFMDEMFVYSPLALELDDETLLHRAAKF